MRRDQDRGALPEAHVRAAHRAPRGFTLVEVIVAIVIGGIVLLGARSLLEMLADEEHHLAVDTAADDARANGYRALRSLVGDMEVGTTESGPFSGDPVRASFTSWCDTPSGRQERCAVTISFESGGKDPALVARLPRARRLVLISGFRYGELRYLNSASSGGQWFRQWGRGITAPLAIGVILERSAEGGATSASATDTLIVRIGERG